jgi:hypothetical protein
MGAMSLVRVSPKQGREKVGLKNKEGTGACKDTTFYCKNEGHIGAKILSSRVGDGLCGECAYTMICDRRDAEDA